MTARLIPNAAGFNANAVLPYALRTADFELAMQDIYDLLADINSALRRRDLRRLEETVRPAVFSGILSDAITSAVARHSRVLTANLFHNGHPDLIPEGRYPHNRVSAGEDGVEIKATRGRGGVDAHGARAAWLCVFRYEVDSVTEPEIDRKPTEITEVLLGKLELDDFRRNARGTLGTPTASPNRRGLEKLRQNWVYRKPTG